MNIKTELQAYRIKLSEPQIKDIYYIEQADFDGRFYITSENGYNGFDGDGFKSLNGALERARQFIQNEYFETYNSGNV